MNPSRMMSGVVRRPSMIRQEVMGLKEGIEKYVVLFVSFFFFPTVKFVSKSTKKKHRKLGIPFLFYLLTFSQLTLPPKKPKNQKIKETKKPKKILQP